MQSLQINLILKSSQQKILQRSSQLEDYANSRLMKYRFTETGQELRIILRHEGYIQQSDLITAKLQQDLEFIFETPLKPIYLSIEDYADSPEQRAPRFYNITDIQQLLGVSRVRVNQLRTSANANFPEPVYSQGHTTLWKAKDIELWASSYRTNKKPSPTEKD